MEAEGHRRGLALRVETWPQSQTPEGLGGRARIGGPLPACFRGSSATGLTSRHKKELSSPDSELEPDSIVVSIVIIFSRRPLTHHFIRKDLRCPQGVCTEGGSSPGPRLCPELLPPRPGARAHSALFCFLFLKNKMLFYFFKFLFLIS